ncbi:hypothetical protein, partial [Enterobacter bugandensis]|uniref:hypothetical protein n=1 Tax=Enterobacter bugandensis TaxID=881260 RepID=UPI0019553DF1
GLKIPVSLVRFRVRAPLIYNPRFGGGFCFLSQQLVGLPVVTLLISPPTPLPGGTTGVFIAFTATQKKKNLTFTDLFEHYKCTYQLDRARQSGITYP